MFGSCLNKNRDATDTVTTEPAVITDGTPSALDRIVLQRKMSAAKLNRDSEMMVIAQTTTGKIVVTARSIDRSLVFRLPSGEVDPRKAIEELRSRATDILLEQTGLATSPAGMKVFDSLEDSRGEKYPGLVAVYAFPLDQGYVERIMAEEEHAEKCVTMVYPLSSAICSRQRKWLNIALNRVKAER